MYAGDDVASGGTGGSAVAVLTEPDLDTIAESVVERVRVEAEFASKVAEQLGIGGGAALRTVAEIIENDEDFAVELKSTARWDLREGKPNKAMEDSVVKTVAGFLNTDGGTLLIGVGPDRQVVGLDHDYPRVKPPNGDGLRQLAHALARTLPRPVDIRPVIDSDDSHEGVVLVDLVDHAVRPPTGGPKTGQFPLQWVTYPVRVRDEWPNHELDDRSSRRF